MERFPAFCKHPHTCSPVSSALCTDLAFPLSQAFTFHSHPRLRNTSLLQVYTPRAQEKHGLKKAFSSEVGTFRAAAAARLGAGAATAPRQGAPARRGEPRPPWGGGGGRRGMLPQRRAPGLGAMAPSGRWPTRPRPPGPRGFQPRQPCPVPGWGRCRAEGAPAAHCQGSVA